MLVALAIRLGYMWQFQYIHPRQGVSVIPFLFESGNIAHSLATGHGFSSPFRVDTGPTAWMTPLFPLLLAGIFRLFGAYTFHAWAATVLLNISCCTLACIPIYFAGKRIGGIALAAGSRLAVGDFSERHSAAGRKHVGRIHFRAAGRDNSVGHAGSGRIGSVCAIGALTVCFGASR